jgi:uncharacterized membrane protein YkgB
MAYNEYGGYSDNELDNALSNGSQKSFWGSLSADEVRALNAAQNEKNDRQRRMDGEYKKNVLQQHPTKQVTPQKSGLGIIAVDALITAFVVLGVVGSFIAAIITFVAVLFLFYVPRVNKILTYGCSLAYGVVAYSIVHSTDAGTGVCVVAALIVFAVSVALHKRAINT